MPRMLSPPHDLGQAQSQALRKTMKNRKAFCETSPFQPQGTFLPQEYGSAAILVLNTSTLTWFVFLPSPGAGASQRYPSALICC